MCRISRTESLQAINFEFTGCDTPQLNGKVKRWIASVTCMVSASLNEAKLPEVLRGPLWGECVMYATEGINALLSMNYDAPPGQMGLFKQELKGIKHQR